MVEPKRLGPNFWAPVVISVTLIAALVLWIFGPWG